MEDVIIIGAGASGLMAGIMAARQGRGCLFLEHENVAGRKLLATGNGKCNFTNRKQEISMYNTKNPETVRRVLDEFSCDELAGFFRELGMEVWERDGYLYPYSGQAGTVRDLLFMENIRLKNRFSYHEHVTDIKALNEGFLVKTVHSGYKGKKLIIAGGGKAQKKLGSDGSMADILKKMGYEVSEFLPALVPLLWDCPYSKELAGIRAKGKISLLVNGEVMGQDMGELQFTDYGISGIPAFMVSRFYSLHRDEKVEALIDFWPHMEKGELERRLACQLKKYGQDDFFYAHVRREELCGKTASAPGARVEEKPPYSIFAQAIKGNIQAKILSGFGNEKLMGVLVEKAFKDMRGNKKPVKNEISIEKMAERLAKDLKVFRAGITGTRGFDFAQVSCGGVSLAEINPETMESKRNKGLYITGELLDVDGCCGGYNLQWAFSTGYLAGKAV